MSDKQKVDFEKFLQFYCQSRAEPIMCTANNKWIFAKFNDE